MSASSPLWTRPAVESNWVLKYSAILRYLCILISCNFYTSSNYCTFYSSYFILYVKLQLILRQCQQILIFYWSSRLHPDELFYSSSHCWKGRSPTSPSFAAYWRLRQLNYWSTASFFLYPEHLDTTFSAFITHIVTNQREVYTHTQTTRNLEINDSI